MTIAEPREALAGGPMQEMVQGGDPMVVVINERPQSSFGPQAAVGNHPKLALHCIRLALTPAKLARGRHPHR